MNKQKKRILVLSARTGGGHRAAAMAIIDELENHNHQLDIVHHDFMENAPRLVRNIPKMYANITKLKSAYGTIFKLTEGSKRAQFALEAIGRPYKKEFRAILDHFAPDVIVSCHFGINPILSTLQSYERTIPFITVVTDLVTGHPMWFDKRADLIIVPSQESYLRARGFGVPSSRLKIIGQPVAAEFNQFTADKLTIKKSLGWSTDVPTLLIMAGGDGMGKLNSLTKKIDTMKADIHIAVITGRNHNLYKSLNARKFNHPAHIYKFRDDIATMMHGSDILLTKAGPGTIVEGIVSRLPVVLYDFLPGQEEGNLLYVVENQAGIWASTNSLAVAAVNDILEGVVQIGGPKYESIRKRHASAAHDIAAIVKTIALDKVK